MAKPFTRQPLVISLTLAMGVGLSIVAAFLVGRWETSVQQVRFQRQIENLATALQRSLNRYTDVLIFLDDYYRVAAGQVSRSQFEQFAARSLQRYPGIQALEWAPLIPQTERTTFEQQVRAEGYPNFQITELGADQILVRATERPYYIPVHYLIPFEPNRAAFGFDLNSSPTRTAAIETARDQGTVTTTQPIRLVQEVRDQYGFLVFLPRYVGGDIPADLPTRRQRFQGFLLGVFRVSDVVEESLRDLRYDIDFVLYDIAIPATPQFLGHYGAVQQRVSTALPAPQEASPIHFLLCPTPEICSRSLSVGDRQWQVRFSTATTYQTSPSYGALITLVVGLSLTSSLAFFLHNLNQELVNAKTLNDLKLRFFSMASHELRTPLSTILLSAESLQLHQADWSEAQKQLNLQRIVLTAKRMGQQITDLLTLTRSEVGRLEFNPELLDVASLCRQIIEDLEPGQTARIRWVNTGASVPAFWDKKLVRSLLTNLLINALKYSPEDSPVDVTLSCTEQAATLTIRDYGIGISPTEKVMVQEAFQRGSNVGNIPGSGLGLAVVKTCIDLHRGTWTIDSVEGQGTTITVTLPLE